VIAVEIGLRLMAGQLDFQPAFFILVLAPEFYLPLRLLGQRFHAGAAGAAGARRILQSLSLAPVQVSGSPGIPPVRSFKPRENLSRVQPLEFISFDRVTFQYPDRGVAAVNDVSLRIQRDQMTVLAGPSGAGKTTLTSLLLGLLQPQSGQIWVDGLKLTDLDPLEWRQQVAWVPQRPYLFQDTLAANIRLGKPDASADEITRAAYQAGLAEWIQSLPQGYQTLVGDQGARLSGGQAQRLALARAFLRDAPVLVLDEPTARLDPELEEELSAAVKTLCRDRLVLMIAHRPETVRQAGQVVFMENGRVVESGNPAELFQKNGALRRLMERPGAAP
jgi:ATP-binding cassette subfamily C protein CydD